MEPIKASKILKLCGYEEPQWDKLTDSDVDRYRKILAIRQRTNGKTVKSLWGDDDFSDYLVTMFDVVFNYHHLLRLEGLWKAFVTRSKQVNASWVRNVPCWEKTLKAPFEYVLRSVLNSDESPLLPIHSEQSFLLEEVKELLYFGHTEFTVYTKVLEQYHIHSDRLHIDPYFKCLLNKAKEEKLGEKIQELEGSMVRMDEPQYSFEW